MFCSLRSRGVALQPPALGSSTQKPQAGEPGSGTMDKEQTWPMRLNAAPITPRQDDQRRPRSSSPLSVPSKPLPSSSTDTADGTAPEAASACTPVSLPSAGLGCSLPETCGDSGIKTAKPFNELHRWVEETKRETTLIFAQDKPETTPVANTPTEPASLWVLSIEDESLGCALQPSGQRPAVIEPEVLSLAKRLSVLSIPEEDTRGVRGPVDRPLSVTGTRKFFPERQLSGSSRVLFSLEPDQIECYEVPQDALTAAESFASFSQEQLGFAPCEDDDMVAGDVCPYEDPQDMLEYSSYAYLEPRTNARTPDRDDPDRTPLSVSQPTIYEHRESFTQNRTKHLSSEFYSDTRRRTLSSPTISGDARECAVTSIGNGEQDRGTSTSLCAPGLSNPSSNPALCAPSSPVTELILQQEELLKPRDTAPLMCLSSQSTSADVNHVSGTPPNDPVFFSSSVSRMSTRSNHSFGSCPPTASRPAQAVENDQQLTPGLRNSEKLSARRSISIPSVFRRSESARRPSLSSSLTGSDFLPTSSDSASVGASGVRPRRNPFSRLGRIVKGRSASDTTAQSGAAVYPWYHPVLSRLEAEMYMRQQPEGSFVVRNTSNGDGYSLSVMNHEGQLVHLFIQRKGDILKVGGDNVSFTNLEDLVKYYR
eukprot:comp22567_c0_seq2/m.34404 comp22567_c0_seq2/g.34404  ORF comp22567_c0_seq2/g.34404 comp22567_c0_seq2/m.34404 type:complete len:652 (-) comp22567_c0_seq2:117-2072(-)